MEQEEIYDKDFDLQGALGRIEYLNLIIVSAAAAPNRLPGFLTAHVDDMQDFCNQMGSLMCLLQAHLADISTILRGESRSSGRFVEFRPLLRDTVEKLQSGAAVEETLHRHLHNIFSFDGLVATDQACADGAYIRDGEGECPLALAWLFETLSCIECGFSLNEILGEAQNTDICTRLCFGDAVDALETWRRDLQLIMPASMSVM